MAKFREAPSVPSALLTVTTVEQHEEEIPMSGERSIGQAIDGFLLELQNGGKVVKTIQFDLPESLWR